MLICSRTTQQVVKTSILATVIGGLRRLLLSRPLRMVVSSPTNLTHLFVQPAFSRHYVGKSGNQSRLRPARRNPLPLPVTFTDVSDASALKSIPLLPDLEGRISASHVAAPSVALNMPRLG